MTIHSCSITRKEIMDRLDVLIKKALELFDGTFIISEKYMPQFGCTGVWQLKRSELAEFRAIDNTIIILEGARASLSKYLVTEGKTKEKEQ